MHQTPARDTSPELSELTRWVYELLDAHRDTASLAADLECDQEWRAHLDYLRDLQRHARESLARVHGVKHTDSHRPGAR
jgi:hypothetical protein